MTASTKCPQCGSSMAAGSTICLNCGYVAQDHSQDDPQGQIETTFIQNTSALPPGTLLHNRYVIKCVLGQGGFGITYEGTDRTLNQRVAIKEYFPKSFAERHTSISKTVQASSTGSLAPYQKGMSSFLREARNLAMFSGEDSFVHVSNFFEENGTAYIVMEYVDGVTVEEFIRRNGPVTFDQCMTYIIPVMNALGKVHERRLIHRDVSPSNIMILRDNRVKLLDFGAAREVTPDHQTMSVIVRPNYAPIEQYSPHRVQGPYTDVYALCATIYTMLTGRVPTNCIARVSSREPMAPPSAYGAVITPVQEEVLMQGLALQPEDRIQTMAELRDRFTMPYARPQKASGPAGGNAAFRSGRGHAMPGKSSENAAFRSNRGNAISPGQPPSRNDMDPDSSENKSGLRNPVVLLIILIDILLLAGIIWAASTHFSGRNTGVDPAMPHVSRQLAFSEMVLQDFSGTWSGSGASG